MKQDEPNAEVETDVALQVTKEKEDTEFRVFLNNINVGFAMAVDEERKEVSEDYSVPRVIAVAEKWLTPLHTSCESNRFVFPPQSNRIVIVDNVAAPVFLLYDDHCHYSAPMHT